jgi:hypothetical protein
MPIVPVLTSISTFVANSRERKKRIDCLTKMLYKFKTCLSLARDGAETLNGSLLDAGAVPAASTKALWL